MFGWLYRMIVGKFHSCDHEWKIIHQRSVTIIDSYDYEESEEIEYHLQCKNCGDMKFAIS